MLPNRLWLDTMTDNGQILLNLNSQEVTALIFKKNISETPNLPQG